MVNIIESKAVYFYADDTILYVSGTDKTVVQSKLRNIFDQFLSWCISNKLTLNAKKTKTMTFFPPKQSAHMRLIQLNANGYPLENVSFYKYLGYMLDEKLNYINLSKQLIKRITCKLYLLAKFRPMLTAQTALTICKSKILTYIDYIFLLYTSFSKIVQRKLQVLQN